MAAHEASSQRRTLTVGDPLLLVEPRLSDQPLRVVVAALTTEPGRQIGVRLLTGPLPRAGDCDGRTPPRCGWWATPRQLYTPELLAAAARAKAEAEAEAARPRSESMTSLDVVPPAALS
jgi:hypothetical protein